MKALFLCVILVLTAQEAAAQAQLIQGGSRHEAAGPPERKERCRSAAAELVRTRTGRAIAQADLEEALWAVRHCESSGVPALLSIWTNPDSDHRDGALRVLVRVTQGIHDQRLLHLMQSMALNRGEPELVRFAALSVLTDYLAPGRSTDPDQWFSPTDPEMIVERRRNHVQWVMGDPSITEGDLRSLRTTLEEIASRADDRARPIAEWMLRLVPAGPSPDPFGGATSECRIIETSRSILELEDGRQVFVQPEAFVSNGSAVFLGGSRNFVTTMDDGATTAVAENEIVGVIVDPGSVTVVDKPGGVNTVTSVRGAPSPRGGWFIVLTDSVIADADAEPRVWFGEHDGRGWLSLDPLPVPPDLTLRFHFASSLAVEGDSLAWAVPTPSRGLVVYRREPAEWEVGVIPTFSATAETEYLESGLRLLVQQADNRLPSDGNSLVVWERRPGWTQLERVVHGRGEGDAFGPRHTSVGDSAVVTWYTPIPDGQMQEVRARWLDSSGRAAGPAVVVAPSAAVFGHDFRPIVLQEGAIMWVVNHAMPDETRLLRFVAMRSGKPVVMLENPDPFMGFTTAIRVGRQDVLVTGLQHIDGRRLASLMVSVRVECHGR